MKQLKIVTDSNPLLHQKSVKVKKFDKRLTDLALAMTQIMRDNDGVGLSAVQVGKPIRLTIIEYLPQNMDEKCREELRAHHEIPLVYLVNPVITKLSRETHIGDEGCLSLPNVQIPIKRSTECNVLAYDLQGERLKIRARDFFARVLQHEIDHLDGILITDKSNGKRYKAIFFGTPEFSVPFLKALIDAPFLDVVAVITEPDRPKGRGKVITLSPIAKFANDNNLPVIKSDRIMNNELRIMNFNPDLAVVVAYGQIIPQKILDISKHGVINVHPSDLPKYRGPAPIQEALLNGEKKTAISVMKMDAKMDHGAILDKYPIKIETDDDYVSLENKILDNGPIFLVETLKKYLNDKIKPMQQDHTKATFTHMIKKENGLINWSKSPINIHNKIRAYSVWPKAYTMINGKRLNILKSNYSDEKLHIQIVQLEGKKPVAWSDFMNGYSKLIPQDILIKTDE